MTKSKPDLTEALKALEEATQALEQMRADQLAYYARPQFSIRHTAAAAQVPERTVRNWLEREIFVPVDDETHQKHRARLFSMLDVVTVATMGRLTSLGMPPSEARLVADLVTSYAQVLAGVHDHVKWATVMVWREGTEWKAAEVLEGHPAVRKAEGMPAVSIRLHVMRLVQETAEGLGVKITYGTAADHRAAADQMDDEAKAS